jgi:hypothetical protein
MSKNSSFKRKAQVLVDDDEDDDTVEIEQGGLGSITNPTPGVMSHIVRLFDEPSSGSSEPISGFSVTPEMTPLLSSPIPPNMSLNTTSPATPPSKAACIDTNTSTSAITEEEAAFLVLSQSNERINRVTPNRGVANHPNWDRLILFMFINTIFNPITRAATIIRQGVSVKNLWLYHNFLMQKERVAGWRSPIFIGFHGSALLRAFFESKKK